MTTEETKTTKSFETAFVEMMDFETVIATIRFIKPLRNNGAMLLIERNGKNYKCYTWFDVVRDIKAPIKAELLVEMRKKDEIPYYNVTAITALQ
jgi:hypothetical protein